MGGQLGNFEIGGGSGSLFIDIFVWTIVAGILIFIGAFFVTVLPRFPDLSTFPLSFCTGMFVFSRSPVFLTVSGL